MDWLLVFVSFAMGAFFCSIIFYFRTTKNKSNLLDAERLIATKSDKIEFLSQHYSELKELLEKEKIKTEDLATSLAICENELHHCQEKLSNQKKDLQESHELFKAQFNNLAQNIFEEKSKKFSQQNKEQLDHLLSPLNDKLKGFEQKIEDTYIKNVKDRSDLQAEIKKLYELNSKISTEANNLTKALKGDVKKQGNWGEFILEKILENSGLQKDIEFKTQVSLNSEDGKKYQPDVVIFLPENKHIIIDSKVSLIAYEKFVNANSKEDQDLFIKEHLNSLKNHIKQLADKQYYKLETLNTPEYVLLFVPIEASFSLAVNQDKSLFNFAWEHKIVIVSPSTLIATLLTVSSIWRQENQTKNALEIAKKSGDLYDKFVGFSENLLDLGHKLKQAQTAYDSSLNKLSQGKGNMIKRAEDIKKLGAKSSKNFPPQLTNNSEIE